MKVFTVGMDEKPPIRDKPVAPDGVSLTSTPIITLKKKRTLYKILKVVKFRFELKHRMGTGCDGCMGAHIIQSFYPQRSSRVFESSDNVAAPTALAMRTGQLDGVEQVTTTSPTLEQRPLTNLPGDVDSRLDFLRKLIPKIKEQAEKSGIKGVMQVKVLQMDSLEPKQPLSLMDGFGGSQSDRAGINALQPNDFVAFSRSPLGTLLADLLQWNVITDNDESRTTGYQFLPPQQDNVVPGEPMLLIAPFLQPYQSQPLLTAWDNYMGLQPRPSDLAQGILKQQQWSNLWQWLNSAASKNRKDVEWYGTYWPNNQKHLPVPVVQQLQQNLLTTSETGNRWQDGGNWMNSVQGGSDMWPQNGWQGQVQQFWPQHPQTLLASMSQNQNLYQNINEWNTRKANIVDNLDGRMIPAILPDDNLNSYINNNANDQWTRYYGQWFANNHRLHQQPIANIAVSQSLEVTNPQLLPQSQSPSQQQEQPQMPDSLQNQMILQQQMKPLSVETQKQKQKPEEVQQFSNQLNQPQISEETFPNAIPNKAFEQSPSVPVSRNRPEDSIPRVPAPLLFNADDWKPMENSNPLVEPVNANQEELQLQHQEPPQVPAFSVANGFGDAGDNTGMIDNGPVKEIGEEMFQRLQSVNDISRRISNPILFQVDEPPPHSIIMEESFAK
uniref:Uncharacterized protein n=1 Tax=Setaria digitata TaxID=48799 RepID=A0A915PP33_9BILA